MPKDYSDEERDAIVMSMLAAMPPLREPGDFTLAEYVEMLRKTGYTIQSDGAIRTRLERMAEGGELQKLTVWDNAMSRPVLVYRPVDAEEVGAD